MMKPIRVENGDGEATVYACIHWRNFPAMFAKLSETPEDLRAQKVMSEAEYQRHKTWEAQCGILKMDESKCLGCPHVRRLEIAPHQVPKMWTLDGKESTPAIDIPSVTAMAKYRRVDMKAQARQSQLEARGATVQAQKQDRDDSIAERKATRGK